MAKKVYDDDDGRTVADMSGIERQRLFIPRLPKQDPEGPAAGEQPPAQKITKEEGRAWFFGALGSALLIGGVFILAAFLFIVIFLAIYH